MNLDERFKKFPIKFYKTKDGIYYENSFIQGKAKDLNDAFNQLKEKNLDFDLYYYYDDVTDLKVGSYEPALTNKNTSKGQYIGQLNLELELDDFDSEHSVKYLSKNPDKIKDHEKFIKKLKDKKKRDKFFNDLKLGIKKVASFFQPQYEMFSPYKTRNDLICDHCGDVIPTGSYYEYWQGKNYHIECIWDKLTNDKKSNEHYLSTEYFLSLQKLLNNWPGNLDCIDDYVSDLNLYKINKRLGLTESAAMYNDNKSNNIKEFVQKILKNPKDCKKAKYIIPNTKLVLPADICFHDKKHPEMTPDNWQLLADNINNIFIANKASQGTTYGKDVYHIGVNVNNIFFAVTVALQEKECFICTAFSTTKTGVISYVLEKGKKKDHSIGSTSQPSTPASNSDNPSGSSVATYSNDLNNIITYIKEKIKR